MNSPLALHQSGFIPANARLLAAASASAYATDLSPTADVIPIYCPNTDTHVTVTRYDDCTVLAFRGTRDLANWLTDAEFFRASIPAGQVHRGFLAAANSVLPLIKAALPPPQASSPKPQAVPLILTGHSLGGALAVLCGYFLAEENYPIHSVYTFGQPRVGNAAFARHYSELLGNRTCRVINQNDLVPRLPGWLLGYRHAGQAQFLTTFGQLISDPPAWIMLLSDALGLWQAWRSRNALPLTDHYIQHYVEKLRALGE
jgi:triacylglycerol lipase